MHVTVQPCIRSVHHYGLIFPTGNKTGHMMSSMNCILIILLMLKILKLSKQSRLFLEQEKNIVSSLKYLFTLNVFHHKKNSIEN